MSELRVFVDTILDHWNRGLGICKGCPFNKVNRSPHFALGYDDARVMVVGESPGLGGETPSLDRQLGSDVLHADEYFGKWLSEVKREHRQKSYRYMEVLEAMVEGTPFEGLQSVYYTNVCKCSPYDRDASELGGAVAHCRPYLTDEVRLLRPRLIVTFGRRAFLALVGIAGVNPKRLSVRSWHGRGFRSSEIRARVLVLQHWGRRRDREYAIEVNRAFRREVHLFSCHR